MINGLTLAKSKAKVDVFTVIKWLTGPFTLYILGIAHIYLQWAK